MKKILLLLVVVAFAGCSKDGESKSGIISIQSDAVIRNNTNAIIDIQSPNEITSVELFVDTSSIGTKFAAPYTFSVNIKDLSVGEHQFNVKATDSSGKVITGSKKFEFVVGLEDLYQGGIIIKLSEDKKHGIIASKEDLIGGTLNKFYYGYYLQNYNAYSLDDGKSNTTNIMTKSFLNGDQYAPYASSHAAYKGYSDWYLPAYNELALFELHRQALGLSDRDSRIYWSSTASSEKTDRAYAYSFGSDLGNPCDMQTRYKVRMCRQF